MSTSPSRIALVTMAVMDHVLPVPALARSSVVPCGTSPVMSKALTSWGLVIGISYRGFVPL